MTDIPLGPDDDGTTVSASVGDRLVITVPENATTGSQWEVESVDGGLAVKTSETVPPAEMRPGQGGAHRVVVHVGEAGHAAVRLRLRRSWEPPEQATERYAVNVHAT